MSDTAFYLFTLFITIQFALITSILWIIFFSLVKWK